MNYQPYIKNGLLCWTLTSNGYKYLTWNFYKHWSQHTKQPICIFCSDIPSYQFLRREGVPCIKVEQTLQDYGPQIVPFGSRQFSVLNRMKLSLLHTLSQDSSVQTCVYLDGDVLLYKDCIPDLLERLELCPLLFQCDEKQHECSQPCSNVCTGCIAFRHGATGSLFKINEQAKWQETPEDQVWVNYTLLRDSVLFDTLPREYYPNGARLTLTQTTPALKEKAYLLHYNYRVGDSKKADMKRYGDWLLPY